MTTVDNQRGILEDTNLRYQDLLSNAQDLDYATAVTKLSAEIPAFTPVGPVSLSGFKSLIHE